MSVSIPSHSFVLLESVICGILSEGIICLLIKWAAGSSVAQAKLQHGYARYLDDRTMRAFPFKKWLRK
jgi:hypothetical protein